jgi:Tetracyclin repressor-like, C-terminal domain
MLHGAADGRLESKALVGTGQTSVSPKPAPSAVCCGALSSRKPGRGRSLAATLADRKNALPPGARLARRRPEPEADHGARPVPRTGRPAEDLAAAFENFRGSLLAHPALVPVVARRPPAGEATREGADRVLALLSGAGLDAATAAAAYQALLFYTLGHALLEAPYALMGPDATSQERQQVRDQLAAASPSHDHLAAAAPRLYTDMDRQFRYGLDLMLTGLGLP